LGLSTNIKKYEQKAKPTGIHSDVNSLSAADRGGYIFSLHASAQSPKMKILLINNHTDYLHNVKDALVGHDVETQVYKPGLDFHYEGKDLIVLSGGGGEGYELKDKHHGKLWYEDEMNFVLGCDKPIFGICMGFEVICAAFGSKVEHIGRLVKGFNSAVTTPAGQKQIARKNLSQFEYHRYGVSQVPSIQFEVLAHSATGIEMIKHHSRPIIATQFHPEVQGGTLQLQELLSLAA
jgi:anthranilate/para-aminobenzoate synthase component II